jgi:transcriptional regulator GlxA family with amidase domain
MWIVMPASWRSMHVAAMTTFVYFLPMGRVVIVVFEGVQTLDVTGPAEVFANASRSQPKPTYEVEVASIGGGNRRTTCGVPIGTRDLRRLRPRRDDLVLVAGGPSAAIVAAVADRELRAWLLRAARTVRRIGSVCSGAFVLAAAGLLDGKRATTHWSACDRLAAMFPAVDVDRNAIFVTDGRTWTSAGVTTGIDMSLANLVLYMRRPGYQSQWSDALVARAGADPLGPTIAWARAHLAKADIDTLAHRAGMSLRTFHRRCLDQLATTPAKLLDKLRVERARDLLATTALPAKALAASCGFTSPARMKRAFERELGIGPRAYRLLHA